MKSLHWSVLLGILTVWPLRAESDRGSIALAQTPILEFPSSALIDAAPAETRSERRAEPRNAMLTLPRVVVEGSKLPNFSEREYLTKEGLSLLLLKRYPGASLPGQDLSNNGIPNYAALMYSDDVRLAQKGAAENLLSATVAQGDAEQVKEFKAEIVRTYLRGHDWRTEGMDKSVNRWRR